LREGPVGGARVSRRTHTSELADEKLRLPTAAVRSFLLGELGHDEAGRLRTITELVGDL
jgi:hypothetical protein